MVYVLIVGHWPVGRRWVCLGLEQLVDLRLGHLQGTGRRKDTGGWYVLPLLVTGWRAGCCSKVVEQPLVDRVGTLPGLWWSVGWEGRRAVAMLGLGRGYSEAPPVGGLSGACPLCCIRCPCNMTASKGNVCCCCCRAAVGARHGCGVSEGRRPGVTLRVTPVSQPTCPQPSAPGPPAG